MFEKIPWYWRTNNTGDPIMNYVAALMRYADDLKEEQRIREKENRQIIALEKENKKLRKKLKKKVKK